MKSKITIIVLAVLLVIGTVVGICVDASQSNVIDTTLDDMKAADNTLNDSITALTGRVTALEAELVEVNAKITSLQTDSATKAELETAKNALQAQIDSLNAVITALQQQADKNKQDIADLTIRVNCLEGKHVVDTTTITYTWANDFSTCTASITCVHCGTVSETAKSTVSDRTCTVSFANEAFSTQTYDLTDLTNMTADQQEKALSVILAAKPTTLTLNLPKDFNSFSLINDLIKSYDKDKYIDLTLKGVETIPEKAFFQNNKLKSITFGDSVKAIGEYAFSNCTSLTSVTFEEGIKLETIGKYAFNYSAITEITVPKSVTSINEGAFYVCLALKSVTFEEGSKLETIGGHALHAIAITSITVPKSVTAIGDWAFAENGSLKTVIFEADSKLETVGDYVFHTCSALTGITIPEGTTSIGEAIFQNCSKLASVTLPSSLTTIGNAAFWSCTSLESIIIPEKTTSIPELLFYGCTALKNITFKSVIESFDISAFAGVTGEDCTLTLAAGQKKLVGVGGTDMVYVPSEDIFCDKTKFCETTFKEIIIAIDATNMSANNLQTTLENYTSKGTTNFELTLAKDTGNNVFSAIVAGLENANDGSVNLTISGAETIPKEAFSENAKLKSVTLGKGVKTIGEGAFIASSLASVKIGADVKTIGKGAFGFTAITEINIPDNVTTIENAAFYYCGSLTSVTLGKGISEISYMAFQNCTALKTITIPSNITTVGTLAFAASGLTSVVIPDTVTSLGMSAFSGCKALASVTIGSGIKSIEAQTFDGCTALKSITVPATVESIGESAFSGTGLTSVTVPDSVTSLGKNAFSGCKALTSVTIGKGVTKMSANVFNSDTALTEITFRGVITEAEYLIFNNINTANITLTLAEGQKLLAGGDDENPWTAASEDFTSGTEFCGCTFKNIILPIEIDTSEMTTEQIEAAVEDAVKNGATDLKVKFSSDAGVDEFNAVFSTIQFNWEECLNLMVTGVTEIPTTVCYNYGWLKSITFGDGITALGGEYTVMNYCSSLECATIGKSVKAINGTVFNDCASLEKIVYEGTVKEWNEITKVANWVKNCPSVTEVVCLDGTVTL